MVEVVENVSDECPNNNYLGEENGEHFLSVQWFGYWSGVC